MAVLDPGPRGDDTKIQHSSHQALTDALAAGKADHKDVLDVGQKAAKDVQVS